MSRHVWIKFSLPRWSARKVTIVLLVGGVLLAILGVIVYVAAYQNRVLPHIVVANSHISGLGLLEASDRLQADSDALVEKTVTLTVNDVEDRVSLISPSDIGLIYDAKATAAIAYQYGRRSDFKSTALEYIKAPFKRLRHNFVITYSQQRLDETIKAVAEKVDTPEINAGVKIEDGKVVETQGVPGKRIDQALVAEEVLTKWRSGDIGEIKLFRNTIAPSIATGETKEVARQAKILRQAKVVLESGRDPISPKQATFDTWITSELNNGVLQVAVNIDTVRAWLQKIAPKVTSEPEEAKLSVKDGVVSIIVPGKIGQSLEIDKTAQTIASEVRNFVQAGSTERQIKVVASLKLTSPSINDQNLSSLGIAELIGSATTSYAGSPENRKHNIAVGARALNGILVKPDEEFSTLRYLGKINDATGYLPELVIKVDKTTPEFGGGLCQVSTTLFRVTMNAGLKITERRNHRYRVGYYEPPVGMDATIYEGSPDYKFVNDTPSNVLIQTRIEGTKITFEMYGKKDGRRSETSTPSLYNVVSPPQAEYIQTDTLPEGTTKQTEKAHSGADASFVYTVINADGSVRDSQTFKSHYQPWRARYLVGTAKAE